MLIDVIDCSPLPMESHALSSGIDTARGVAAKEPAATPAGVATPVLPGRTIQSCLRNGDGLLPATYGYFVWGALFERSIAECNGFLARYRYCPSLVIAGVFFSFVPWLAKRTPIRSLGHPPLLAFWKQGGYQRD